MDQIFNQLYQTSKNDTDAYINDLLSSAGGDRDFAIKQLKREHDLALGTDDQARAQFLESVADKLEERIGTIPYDYNVGVTRTNEDLARTTEITNRNKNQVLSRLAEDEKIWKENFATTSAESKQNQNEALLQRGILSGTRAGAEGLAGSEVKKFDTELAKQMKAYNLALGRSRSDTEQAAGDTLFTAGRDAARTLQDLKTTARRDSTASADRLSFGSEAAQREYEKTKKRLADLRQQGYETGATQSLIKAGQIYG